MTKGSDNYKNVPDNLLLNITIVIITKNVERTIGKVLKSISIQNYPAKNIEICVVDGNSTDATLEIIRDSNLKINILKTEFPDDPEACRGVGLKHSKNEIIAFIDADNYLPHKYWLRKMVYPFIHHPEIVGSETMRYAYRKKDTALNRYFALLGSADPVGLYLGKADKLSYLYDNWNLYGKVISQHAHHFIVDFDIDHFPTLGSNGFLARRKLLLKAKSDPGHYFHIDVPLDLARMGFSRYAVVKDEIIHDTAVSLGKYLQKRITYMKLHYQKRAGDRRYKVFNPERTFDILNLFIFIVFSLTIIQPFYIGVKGFLKKQDIAWFIHPIFCFSITLAYGYAVLSRLSFSMVKRYRLT